MTKSRTNADNANADITGVTAGTGLTGGGTNGTVTVSIDSTVATLTDSQTLTNKTLTSPVLGGVSTSASGNIVVKPATNILEVQGDNSSVVGQIQLNCHVNSHGQKIASQPHAQGATNTLTLPGGSTIGNSDAVLVSNTGTQTLTNKTLTSPQEITTVTATAATGTINYDAVTQSVLYYTSNASGNWTLNIRGNSSTSLSSLMDVGDAITVTHLVTQGATAYYNSALQIDGSSVTPKYQGGTAPSSGNTSSIDVYVYAVIKTAATPTYTVFASQTKFA